MVKLSDGLSCRRIRTRESLIGIDAGRRQGVQLRQGAKQAFQRAAYCRHASTIWGQEASGAEGFRCTSRVRKASVQGAKTCQPV